MAVRLHDGRELVWACDSMLASPARRLTRAQHLAKFRRCWSFADASLTDVARDTMIERVDVLETLDDVAELVAGKIS